MDKKLADVIAHYNVTKRPTASLRKLQIECGKISIKLDHLGINNLVDLDKYRCNTHTHSSIAGLWSHFQLTKKQQIHTDHVLTDETVKESTDIHDLIDESVDEIREDAETNILVGGWDIGMGDSWTAPKIEEQD